MVYNKQEVGHFDLNGQLLLISTPPISINSSYIIHPSHFTFSQCHLNTLMIKSCALGDVSPYGVAVTTRRISTIRHETGSSYNSKIHRSITSKFLMHDKSPCPNTSTWRGREAAGQGSGGAGERRSVGTRARSRLLAALIRARALSSAKPYCNPIVSYYYSYELSYPNFAPFPNVKMLQTLHTLHGLWKISYSEVISNFRVQVACRWRYQIFNAFWPITSNPYLPFSKISYPHVQGMVLSHVT